MLECVIPRGLHQGCKTYRDAFIAHLDAFLYSFIPYRLAAPAHLCIYWTYSCFELMYIGIVDVFILFYFVLSHQENSRVIFGVFVSGNNISGRYVFVSEVFPGFCLCTLVFNI